MATSPQMQPPANCISDPQNRLSLIATQLRAQELCMQNTMCNTSLTELNSMRLAVWVLELLT